MPENLFLPLLHHGRNAALATPESEKESWGPLYSGVRSYEQSFGLASGSLRKIVESQKKSGPVVALDVMGNGTVLNLLPIDYKLAIALSEPPENQGVPIVTGTVVSKKLWRKVQNWLQDLPVEEKKFTLILSRPAALNNETIPSYRDVYYYLIQQAYHLLSRNNGVMITQIPKDADEIAKKWVTQIQQASMNAQYESMHLGLQESGEVIGGVLTLNKTLNSPDKLPPLKSD